MLGKDENEIIDNKDFAALRHLFICTADVLQDVLLDVLQDVLLDVLQDVLLDVLQDVLLDVLQDVLLSWHHFLIGIKFLNVLGVLKIHFS